jgi:hypothetical protein
MIRKLSVLLPIGVIGVIFLAVFLGGCGGANSAIALGELQVPTVLKRYEGAYEPTVDCLVVSLLRAMGDGCKLEVDYYWLPETTEWKDIEESFTKNLDESWLPDEDGDLVDISRWKRKVSHGDQVLVLSKIPVVDSGGDIVAVMLKTP